MTHKNTILKFCSNRVWRTYPGGKILDELEGKETPKDTHFPEDWIGSTTLAVNPDREHITEGVSRVTIDDDSVPFDELLKQDPHYFLGEQHIAKFGTNPMLLVKLLDSAVRLQFQAHPTAEFAREKLNSNHGKAEGYYILQVRDDIENPYVYVGFQYPPTRENFKAMIKAQDIEAMEQCFEKIPVKQGDCLFIPGGAPHAIGEGILMVEIMEPSDWAVRFEFTKAGYTMPEDARFMKRGLDFCLDVFDYSQLSVEDAIAKFHQQPKLIRQYNADSSQESLIDETVTDKFRVKKSTVKGSVVKTENDFFIGLVTEGACTIQVGNELIDLKKFDRFFCPAGIESLTITSDEGVEILECFPPSSDH